MWYKPSAAKDKSKTMIDFNTTLATHLHAYNRKKKKKTLKKSKYNELIIKQKNTFWLSRHIWLRRTFFLCWTNVATTLERIQEYFLNGAVFDVFGHIGSIFTVKCICEKWVCVCWWGCVQPNTASSLYFFDSQKWTGLDFKHSARNDREFCLKGFSKSVNWKEKVKEVVIYGNWDASRTHVLHRIFSETVQGQ